MARTRSSTLAGSCSDALISSCSFARPARERRLVADEPYVPEGVGESALPVHAPRNVVVPDVAQRARRAGSDGTSYEGIRIVGEHLDPYCRRSELLRGVEPASHLV